MNINHDHYAAVYDLIYIKGDKIKNVVLISS